jgi:RNA polymerase sigma factor (sigma-70 family)
MDLSVMQYLDVAASADADAASPGGIDDGLALREVLVMHYESLKRRLVRKLGCPDLASDCLHDAWLRLGEFTAPVPTRSPQAYVYRVACNVAIDGLRRNRLWQPAGEEEEAPEAMADPAPGPDVIVEKRSEMRAMDRALQRLPGRHRAVLVALRIEERTREEVADWLQMSLRSVDTTLRQALDHCAEVSGQTVCVGVSGPRRHWRADAEVRR